MSCGKGTGIKEQTTADGGKKNPDKGFYVFHKRLVFLAPRRQDAKTPRRQDAKFCFYRLCDFATLRLCDFARKRFYNQFREERMVKAPLFCQEK
jgi:hypothetical protein